MPHCVPAAVVVQSYDAARALGLPFAKQVIDSAAHYSATRLRDHLAGRLAAHEALCRLGAPDAIVSRQPTGAPVWPPGYSGSISHCGGLGLALAMKGEARIGVDVERVDRVELLSIASFVRPDEGGRAALDVRAKASLFSIKEAAFKALGPYQPSMFDPLAIQTVEMDAHSERSFSARLVVTAGYGDVGLQAISVVRGAFVYAAAWQERTEPAVAADHLRSMLEEA